jgi:hypothetical protein
MIGEIENKIKESIKSRYTEEKNERSAYRRIENNGEGFVIR